MTWEYFAFYGTADELCEMLNTTQHHGTVEVVAVLSVTPSDSSGPAVLPESYHLLLRRGRR